MIVDHSTLLFFDASCLIAREPSGRGSPSGGSGFLLALCATNRLRGAVSQYVLLEAERNITSKLGSEALRNYRRLLLQAPLVMAPVPQPSPRQLWRRVVNAKDAHVVAAALAIKAPFLLTLDRGLLDQISQTALALEVLTPGDFIRTVLPRHADYPGLRT